MSLTSVYIIRHCPWEQSFRCQMKEILNTSWSIWSAYVWKPGLRSLSTDCFKDCRSRTDVDDMNFLHNRLTFWNLWFCIYSLNSCSLRAMKWFVLPGEDSDGDKTVDEERIKEGMNEGMNEWMNEGMKEWMNEWMKGRTEKFSV
jgi:hypothetical protein